MKYVIIGNGVAGFTAAQVLANELIHVKNSEIIQFTEEKFTYYPRPRLYEFLRSNNLNSDDLLSYKLDWYQNHNVDLHIGEKVLEIDTDSKKIETQNGTYSYSLLLFTTGADCYCPPLPGIELTNFFTLRTLTDAIAIRKQLQNSKSVVIIGGGILGIEIANACAERGLSTTIVEFYPYLLPKQLDQEGGEVLQKILENRKINFFVNAKVEKITGENQVKGVVLSDGTHIPAEIVLACTGIAPRNALAQKAGLKVNKGIIVDEHLETSVHGVYAAGDAAEFKGRIYGIIPPSIEQAQIAAYNMVHQDNQKEYNGSRISATLKVIDLFLTSIGYSKDEVKNWKSSKFLDINNCEYVKLFMEEENLKAAIILGTKKGITQIRKLIDKPLLDYKNELNELFPNIL